MNLSIGKWIPVVNAHGQPSTASLLDLFDAEQEIRDLAVTAPQRIAIYRLLICIAQTALDGPATREEWEICQPEIATTAHRYLVKWQDRFELFDDRHPFLQFPGLSKPVKSGKATEEESWVPASKLDFALSTGNNTTLFDHAAATDLPRVFEPWQLALTLLGFQSFSPGGRIGVASWHGKETSGKGSSSHALCSSSAMLHVFIRKETVLATIHANLLTKVEVANEKLTWGRPLWEHFPSSFDDAAAITNATTTYLGRLVPLSRAILLYPDCVNMILGNGLTYNSFPNHPPEPSASTVIGKDNQRRLLGIGSRPIWRELPAALCKRRMDQPGGPAILGKVDESTAFDLWAGAFQTDKATILGSVESVFHIPPRLMSEPGRLAYEEEIQLSQKISQTVAEAADIYRKHLEAKPQNYPEKRDALSFYWTRIEQALPLLNAHFQAPENSAEADAFLEKWRRTLWSTAYAAYTACCPAQTPRKRRASQLGLNVFHSRKPFSTSQPK